MSDFLLASSSVGFFRADYLLLKKQEQEDIKWNNPCHGLSRPVELGKRMKKETISLEA